MDVVTMQDLDLKVGEEGGELVSTKRAMRQLCLGTGTSLAMM
jgi:hypothetical protein